MPLKLNVGLARKVGETNYGSRGASINVEMEVDSSLATDPAKLQERIRGMFNFVRHAVDDELGTSPNHRVDAQPVTDPHRRLTGPNNGAGTNGHSNNGVRPATQSQIKAIYSIAKNQKLDAGAFVREHFHVNRVEDLSIKQASLAIDELKAEKGR